MYSPYYRSHSLSSHWGHHSRRLPRPGTWTCCSRDPRGCRVWSTRRRETCTGRCGRSGTWRQQSWRSRRGHTWQCCCTPGHSWWSHQDCVLHPPTTCTTPQSHHHQYHGWWGEADGQAKPSQFTIKYREIFLMNITWRWTGVWRTSGDWEEDAAAEPLADIHSACTNAAAPRIPFLIKISA